ncbi:MAG: beta-ketoacyl synthase chain length factor, partial [Myxococcota bacterium]
MSDALPTVRLRGHAFWAPGFDSLEQFVAGEADESVKKPPLSFVPSRMRRATSLATRMAVECAHRAVHAAGFDLAHTATVFGSQHGEIQIAVDQMVMMEDGEGQISPARFKNSVHNTAAGLFSITAENKG